jgi:hypothetical protein
VPYFLAIVALDYRIIEHTDLVDLVLTLWVLWGYFWVFMFQ